MTRHETHRRPTRAGRIRRSMQGQTAAASALAGGCLAVIALWKTAGNATAGGGR